MKSALINDVMIEDEKKENDIDNNQKHTFVKSFDNKFDAESIYFIDAYLKNVTRKEKLRQNIPNEIKYIILNFSANTFVIGYGHSDYFKVDSIKVDNIVKCASFCYHSLFVDIKGSVYGIGINQAYQLGLGHNDEVDMPQLISIEATIVEVAVGYQHSILLCVKGCIYTMGNNECNQCGQRNGKYIKSPTRCEYFGSKHIVKISAGAFHSGCITSHNCVYLFGLNDCGQCGVGKETDTTLPQKMDVCAHSFSCGGSHTLITSTNNKLYACGMNDDGQIGNGTKKDQFGLIQIELPHNVIDADCGSDHSLCILENGAAYSWGQGVCGQLGHGDDNDKLVPTQIKVQNIKFKKCVAGPSNSCLIDGDDNFYCFGCNGCGELHVDDRKNKFIPTKIREKNVLDISMGYRYSFLMVTQGQKRVVRQENDETMDN